MVPVSNRSHEERLGVDICGTLWDNKRSGVVCLVFSNNVCDFAVLKHVWFNISIFFVFIGVRYRLDQQSLAAFYITSLLEVTLPHHWRDV